MKLNLDNTVFQSAEWTAEPQGTLVSNMEVGDRVEFNPNNLARVDKNIQLRIYEAGKPSPKKLGVSKALTAVIRKALDAGKSKTEVLKRLIWFPIIKNETGYFLTLGNSRDAEGLDFTTEVVKEPSNFELAGF